MIMLARNYLLLACPFRFFRRPVSPPVIYGLVFSLDHCLTHVGFTFSARGHSQLILLLELRVPICTNNSALQICTFRRLFHQN